jgi:hypothetical protein
MWREAVDQATTTESPPEERRTDSLETAAQHHPAGPDDFETGDESGTSRLAS